MATTQEYVDVAEMGAKTKEELLALAESAGLSDGPSLSSMRREEILSKIFQAASAAQALIASGVLETMDEGYGFLRQISPEITTGDVYISQSQIRRFGLRTGDTVSGQVARPKKENATSDWCG